MRAIITQKSELDLNLQQSYTFDIITDEGEEVLTSNWTNRGSLTYV